MIRDDEGAEHLFDNDIVAAGLCNFSCPARDSGVGGERHWFGMVYPDCRRDRV